MTDRTNARKRSAFTLIELLVVIAIMAVLIALTTAAATALITGQKRKNTTVLMEKVHGALERHWSVSLRNARAASLPPRLKALIGDDERARVIWVKLQLKRDFPMTYAEALNPAGTNSAFVSSADLRPHLSYVRALERRQSTNAQAEASACLLLALSRTIAGIEFKAEEALGPGSIADTDGDGVNEIVDGWDSPVAFYRWGTGNNDLDVRRPPSRAPSRDIEDPLGKLMDLSWNVPDNPIVQAFERELHPITGRNPQGAVQPRSYYTVPTVVSAGPNKRLGLDARMVPTADAADNVYSFNRQ